RPAVTGIAQGGHTRRRQVDLAAGNASAAPTTKCVIAEAILPHSPTSPQALRAGFAFWQQKRHGATPARTCEPPVAITSEALAEMVWSSDAARRGPDAACGEAAAAACCGNTRGNRRGPLPLGSVASPN